MGNTYDATGATSGTPVPGQTAPVSEGGPSPNQPAPAVVTDPSGVAVQYDFDSSGRLIATHDATGDTTSYSWSAANNLTSVTLPGTGSPTHSFTYDARGNRLSETNPLCETSTFVYDSRDNLTSSADPLSHATTFVYSAANNLLSSTDATSRTTTYAYNANGTLASTTDPASKTTTFAYDAAGNVLTKTDPLGHTASSTYAYDRLASRTDGRGRLTSYVYDAWGRRTAVDYAGTSNDVTLSYDAMSRLTQSVDATGTRAYAYDAWGNKTSQTDPRGTTSAAYDLSNRLSNQTDVSGRTLTYGYDADGRLSTIGDGSATATTVYDAQGRVATETYTNGTNSAYTYDSAGRVSTLQHKKGASLLIGYAATYDDAGRLTSVVSGGATSSFTWNNDDTLASYPGSGYTRRLEYDGEGQIAAIKKDVGGVVTPKSEYAYGFDGARRSRKDLANNAWNWFPCGVACCAGELVTLGSDLTGSTWSTVSTSLGKGKTYRVGAENRLESLGSRLAVVTNASGNVVASYAVDSFGVVRSQTSAMATALARNEYGVDDDEAYATTMLAFQLNQQEKPITPTPRQVKPGKGPWPGKGLKITRIGRCRDNYRNCKQSGGSLGDCQKDYADCVTAAENTYEGCLRKVCKYTGPIGGIGIRPIGSK